MAQHSICGTDLDFYGFAAEAGTSIDVNLIFTAENGDLGLRLYRDGIVVGEAQSLRDGERLKVYSSVGGAFVIEVFGQGPFSTVLRGRER